MIPVFTSIKDLSWIQMGWITGIIAVSLLIGFISRAVLRYLLVHWASKTESKLDDYFLEALARYVIFWSLLLGMMLLIPLLHLPPRHTTYVAHISLVLFLLSLTLMFGNLSVLLTPVASRHFELPLSTTSFAANFVRLLIFILGGLLILSNVGVSIGPVLTAFGVGSLAVGLALQDMLTNLFAGFYLFFSRQIQVGDYIEIERGSGYIMRKGYVVDISWRLSRIRTLSDTIVDIPNGFLTQSVIRQYDNSPDHALIPVEVQLGSKADLTIAEQVAKEVFEKMKEEHCSLSRIQFLSATEPLMMTVIFEVPRFFDQDRFLSTFIKQLRKELLEKQLL